MTQITDVTSNSREVNNREMLTLGGDFERILETARDIKANSVDYTVPTKDVRVDAIFNEKKSDLAFTFLTDAGWQTDFISDFALGQLSTKAGVPTSYLRRCLEKQKPVLARDNINTWLKDQRGNMFIREHNRRVRGILSDRYAVYDTIDALDVIANTVDTNRLSVKGYSLSPERFHLRFAQTEQMNVPNEDLFAGLSIDNSDVGRSTLSVRFLVFKKVCTNGLIVAKGNGELFRQKHMGLTSERFAEEFSENMKNFPQIVAEVEDRIKATKEAPLFYNFDYKNKVELDALIKEIKEDASVSDTTANNVIEIVRSGRYENNRWGYINALTEAAQPLSLEERLDVEKYAGSLLVA